MIYDREWWVIIWSIWYFCLYLVGRYFIVVIDYKFLVGSRNIDLGSDFIGWRVRWVIELFIYDFVIVYCDGLKYMNVDVLSCVLVEMVNNV